MHPKPYSGGDRGAAGGARGESREVCGGCGRTMVRTRTGDYECERCTGAAPARRHAGLAGIARARAALDGALTLADLEVDQ